MSTSSSNFLNQKQPSHRSSFWLVMTAAVLALVGVLVVGAMLGELRAGGGGDETEAGSKKAAASKAEKADNPFPDRPPAPELDGGTGWLNTTGEISLKDLRGKVVLLDFWTYCCINCMHILPDLKYLEHKYANELVVIGVHSAKFENEKDSEAIRRAIVRYEIEHPVINDSEMILWQKFGSRSWPTLVLIDPEGKYCGFVSGEGNRELLDTVIGKLVSYHKSKGTLDQKPIAFNLERNRVKGGALKFPGKVLADEAGQRLFISDSNHNRIVVSSLDGKLIDVIGGGTIGRRNGSFEEAQFDHPQGMALHNDLLYIADTENHLLRVADLKAKTVRTLAGTGEQGHFRARGGKLLETALNSPWDLEIVDKVLYVAMAGPHQIWSHKMGSGLISVFAGTGREDILDGPHDEAALAQPSGLSSDGEALYVSDSEGSAIRRIGIAKGDVTTVVGTHDLPNGRSLFEFGDQDGVGTAARLQHPLGVEFFDGGLFVADSYNHKIKTVDLKTRTATSWIGTGKMGAGLDPVQLHEPAGLTFANGKMYIADTNNHRILVADLKTKQTTELTIEGLTAPKTDVEATVDVSAGPAGKAQSVPEQKIAGPSIKLVVALQAPEGYKVNAEYPLAVSISTKDDQKLLSAAVLGKRHRGTITDQTAQIEIPLDEMSGKATFNIALSWSYCRAGNTGVCRLQTSRWSVPIEVAAGGAAQIELKTEVPAVSN